MDSGLRRSFACLMMYLAYLDLARLVLGLTFVIFRLTFGLTFGLMSRQVKNHSGQSILLFQTESAHSILDKFNRFIQLISLITMNPTN